MRKTAIFVEGQTELIFVREYLLKHHEYQDISIDCYTLFTDASFNTTEYPYPNENAERYFQIIDVGNDNAVLSRLLKREKYLWNAGFDYIIALRDMYSKDYRKSAIQTGEIDPNLNQQFIDEFNRQIQARAIQPHKIDFCFAVMEAEAWFLGLHHCFEKINPLLTHSYIKSELGYDLQSIDPETTFFHPAKVVEEIYSLANERYGKSKGNIEAIMASLDKNDFQTLDDSLRCASFSTFVELLRK